MSKHLVAAVDELQLGADRPGGAFLNADECKALLAIVNAKPVYWVTLGEHGFNDLPKEVLFGPSKYEVSWRLYAWPELP